MWKKKENKKDFEKRMSDTTYKMVVDTLESILNTKITKTGSDGTAVVDTAATLSAIRTKARIALDFVTDLENGIGKDNK